MLKDKGAVVNVDELATSEPLNHHVNMLGGSELAEQLKCAVVPISPNSAPVMTGVSGPTKRDTDTAGHQGVFRTSPITMHQTHWTTVLIGETDPN